MNTQTPDGGPAFPTFFPDPEVGSGYAGMTLRDYFAGQALAGYLASPINKFTHQLDVDPEQLNMGVITRDAYDLADAMISAREGKPK